VRKTSAQIADEVVATPTKEMLDHFNNRTNRHIELVRKYCTKLEERVPGLEGLHQRGLDHDQSKYESKEKIPYVWLTWRYKCEDDKKPCVLPTGMKRMIDEATEHHILTNAHHPEFHRGKTSNLINKEDRDKPPKEMIDATRMSKLDLAEMVADWCAMSEERGNTPHEWAKKNVNVRWKYTPEQVKHINQFMDAAWHKSKTAAQIADEVLKKQPSRVFYHGTRPSAIAEIQKSGLKPEMMGTGWEGDAASRQYPAVSLTTRPEHAQAYGALGAWDEGQGLSALFSKPVILQVTIPPEHAKHLKEIVSASGHGGFDEWHFRSHIPPEWISVMSAKTASEIGDEVLEKRAIDLPTLRRVSSGLLKQHGVRGGRSTAFDRVWRRPIESHGPEVLPDVMTGREVSPIRRALVRLFPGVKRLSRGTEFDVELLKQLPGPILSGGRRGTLTSLVQRSPLVGAPTPPSPLGKEVLNRVALLHEGFEREALGKGMSMADRMRGWGDTPHQNVEKIRGVVGGGHMSPKVILREHNVVSSLPEFSNREEVQNVMRVLRDRDKTWSKIQQSVGRELPYGEQRLSRHAIRRIEDLIRR
jgi:hypothetical protein